MFPSGNKMDSISLYLDVADSDSLGEVWSRRASFTLTLVNQLDASRNIVKGTNWLNSGIFQIQQQRPTLKYFSTPDICSGSYP